MDKIWIIKQGRSYRMCRNERDMIRRTSATSTTQEILEYTMVGSSKAVDYFKSKERDTQLKSILGELGKTEQAIHELISLYEKITPDGNEKIRYLDRMKRFQGDKKAFSSLLVSNKKYFLNISTDVEWLRSILLCHNFTSHLYDRYRWDSVSKTQVIIDKASDELKANFLLAKESLRKKKKPTKSAIKSAIK